MKAVIILQGRILFPSPPTAPTLCMASTGILHLSLHGPLWTCSDPTGSNSIKWTLEGHVSDTSILNAAAAPTFVQPNSYSC